ncbi:MAG: hypothetical protein EBY39_02775 [Flavobacteriia bacterium]|nr:hypothetical protein [Flavobacteriia bacterium]
MNVAKCTRNSQIMRNIQNGHYVSNQKFRDYGELECDRPSWDMRVRRQGKQLQNIENKNKKKTM